MEKDKKVEEPFDPQRTPEPPQQKDPSTSPTDREKREVKQPDAKERRTNAGDKDEKESKPKMVGDETEIEDETAI